MADSPIKFCGYKGVFEALNVKSRNTVKRLIDEEGFPEPYEIMQGRKAFYVPEIEKWVRERMQSQRGEAA